MSEAETVPDTAPVTAPARTRAAWVDVVALVVLSAVAVVTAWCGFESSKWGGEMSISFSQASALRVKASDASSAARDQRQIDLTVFAEWLTATDSGNTELATFIEDRFPPSLATAFEAWDKKTDSPFALPEYVPPGQEAADDLNAKADAAYAQALVNNQRGDNYTLLTVLFALVLFLSALAQRDGPAWSRRTLLIIALAFTILGVAIMLTFPIRI